MAANGYQRSKMKYGNQRLFRSGSTGNTKTRLFYTSNAVKIAHSCAKMLYLW